MTDDAIAQHILDEIKRLATRFERVEAGMATLDGRMAAFEGGMAAFERRMATFEGGMATLESRMATFEGGMATLDGRMATFEGGMATLDGRMAAFEGGMAAFERRMAALEIHMSILDNRMSNVETAVANLDVRISSWPDMHYLASAAKAQLIHSRELKANVSDIGIRVGEIFQAMATDPEIRSLREEVSRFRDQSLETEIRLGTLERHLAIRSSVEPR